MPELPEVETVRRDLERWLGGRKITGCQIHNDSLRTKVPATLPARIVGRKVLGLRRRAKYILADFTHGVMGIHLGMSGSVRVAPKQSELQKHDHVVWQTAKLSFCYNDPRRFGMIFWHEGDGKISQLANAGVEPLLRGFTAAKLRAICAQRKSALKLVIMNSALIAGVGNIYASESLFRARLDPAMPAAALGPKEAARLVKCIKEVLREAIKAGGSSLRNHRYGRDKTGYFQTRHRVYGRQGKPCLRCKTPIERSVLGQRATFYCPSCQLSP